MPSELPLQTDIKKSVRKDGGHSFKMSNRFSIGIPDLFMAIFPFAPILAEVKDLGECVDNFSRQLNVSEKQKYELRALDDVYSLQQSVYTPSRHASVLLVGVRHKGVRRLVGLPWSAERLDAGYLDEPASYRNRETGGYFDLKPILEHLGCIKVKL